MIRLSLIALLIAVSPAYADTMSALERKETQIDAAAFATTQVSVCAATRAATQGRTPNFGDMLMCFLAKAK